MIPYETIEPATKGDLRAILKILKHYDPYITRLAMRPALGTERPSKYHANASRISSHASRE